MEDDNIVAGSSTYLIAAGIVHDVDSSGVWVDQRPQSLALARRMARAYVVTTAAAATATAAQCFQENCLFAVAGTASVTLTLPTAIAGYRVGVQRTSATATHDVVVQAPTGDTIRGSAAAGAITNSTDLVSDVLWLLAISAVAWVDDNPVALDRAAWAAST